MKVASRYHHTLRLLFASTILFFSGCSGDDPTPPHYNSVHGKWKYETPDKKMRVEFEIYDSQGELKIESASISVDDKVMIAKLDEFTMDADGNDIYSIHLRDEKLTGPFILFQTVTYNEAYSELYASQVDYAVTAGVHLRLNSQVIVRR